MTDKKTLFDLDETYTDEGRALADKVLTVLAPIFEEYSSVCFIRDVTTLHEKWVVSVQAAILHGKSR